MMLLRDLSWYHLAMAGWLGVARAITALGVGAAVGVASASTLAAPPKGTVPEFKVRFAFRVVSRGHAKIRIREIQVRPVIPGEQVYAALRDNLHIVRRIRFARRGSTAVAYVRFTMVHSQMIYIYATDATLYGRNRNYNLRVDTASRRRSKPVFFNEFCLNVGTPKDLVGDLASCQGKTWAIFTHWAVVVGGYRYLVGSADIPQPQRSWNNTVNQNVAIFSYCSSQAVTSLFAYFVAGGETQRPDVQDWYLNGKNVLSGGDPTLAGRLGSFGITPATSATSLQAGEWEINVHGGASMNTIGWAKIQLTPRSC